MKENKLFFTADAEDEKVRVYLNVRQFGESRMINGFTITRSNYGKIFDFIKNQPKENNDK